MQFCDSGLWFGSFYSSSEVYFERNHTERQKVSTLYSCVLLVFNKYNLPFQYLLLKSMFLQRAIAYNCGFACVELLFLLRDTAKLHTLFIFIIIFINVLVLILIKKIKHFKSVKQRIHNLNRHNVCITSISITTWKSLILIEPFVVRRSFIT